MLTLQPPAHPANAGLVDLAARYRAAYPALRPPLPGVWSDDPLLVLDRDEQPWLLTPTRRDPQAHHGRLVLPAEQRRQLTEVARLGIPFDDTAIAHELAAGRAGRFVSALRAGPRRCTDALARELVGPVPPDPRVARAVGMLRTAVEAVLDPILFGAVAPGGLRHGHPCLYFPVLAWAW